MIKRTRLVFALLGLVLLTGCDTSMIVMRGSEGSGTPTVVMAPDSSVASTAITIDSTSTSTVTIMGLKSTYRVGEVAKFSLVFINRGNGNLIVNYQLRLMNQDQNQPREYAYGTGGSLLLYATETTPVDQQITMPAKLTPGAYVMNVYISRVLRDNQTIAKDLSLSQTVNISQ